MSLGCPNRSKEKGVLFGSGIYFEVLSVKKHARTSDDLDIVLKESADD
jgi:hypothetical protein